SLRLRRPLQRADNAQFVWHAELRQRLQRMAGHGPIRLALGQHHDPDVALGSHALDRTGRAAMAKAAMRPAQALRRWSLTTRRSSTNASRAAWRAPASGIRRTADGWAVASMAGAYGES